MPIIGGSIVAVSDNEDVARNNVPNEIRCFGFVQQLAQFPDLSIELIAARGPLVSKLAQVLDMSAKAGNRMLLAGGRWIESGEEARQRVAERQRLIGVTHPTRP